MKDQQPLEILVKTWTDAMIRETLEDWESRSPALFPNKAEKIAAVRAEAVRRDA
jgi:hypothetical protein